MGFVPFLVPSWFETDPLIEGCQLLVIADAPALFHSCVLLIGDWSHCGCISSASGSRLATLSRSLSSSAFCLPYQLFLFLNSLSSPQNILLPLYIDVLLFHNRFYFLKQGLLLLQREACSWTTYFSALPNSFFQETSILLALPKRLFLVEIWVLLSVRSSKLSCLTDGILPFILRFLLSRSWFGFLPFLNVNF